MRLENRVYTAEPAIARGGERRANLRRMVAVIVDDRDAALLPALLESPVDAVKLRKPLANDVGRNLQLQTNRDRGRRVQHVVRAGHAEMKFARDPDRRDTQMERARQVSARRRARLPASPARPSRR